MKLKIYNNIQRFTKIVKKAFLTPNLPPHILKIERLLFIRVGRFLGGVSFLLLLGSVRGYLDLHGYLLHLIFVFSLCFFIYHCYISYHRFKFIKAKLKTNELEIRNSPLDRFGSKLLRILYCAKGYCDNAAPLGLGLGLMIGVDQVLKDGGREAFFGPLLGGGLNKILPQSDLDHWRDAYLNATKNLDQALKTDQVIKEFLAKTSELGGTAEDKKDLLEFLAELKNASSSELENAKSQALKILQDKDKNS
jgi:hypothetical protein